MGKVMRHTLGASLNIRHNLSSSKGPKPLQLKLLTTYIPKTSAFTLAFSTSQRLRTTRASARTFFTFRHYITYDCYQYFCVPEYGTANGRLHFHAVHFMRTLPTGSVDPNFGRRVRNRRQLNSLQNTWPYGYSMPIA